MIVKKQNKIVIKFLIHKKLKRIRRLSHLYLKSGDKKKSER